MLDSLANCTRAAALNLVRRGFRVFRIGHGTKGRDANGNSTIVDKDWATGATDEPLDVFDKWNGSEYNIGVLATGLVILDVDVRATKDGRAELEKLGPLPETFTVRTPSGGLHLFFDAQGVAYGQGDLAPGINVRATNGYVIGAGSVYAGKPYVIERDVPIAPLPAHIAEKLKAAATRKASKGAVHGELDTDLAVSSARRYLEHEAKLAVQGDNGDNTTFKVTCRVLDFGLTEDTALELLAEHWNERCSPPWPLEELKRKLENACAYRKSAIGRDNPLVGFKKIAPPPPSSEKGAPSPDMGVVRNVCAPAPRFPSELFGPLQPWIEQQAEAKGAPPDYVAAGLLSAVAVLIGMTRQVTPSPGWIEPPILWCAAIGAPSTNKSPGLDAPLRPLGEIEQAMGVSFFSEMRQYEANKLAAQTARAVWEGDVKTAVKQKVPPPPLPQEAEEPPLPVRPRLVVQDATTESLAAILAQWPRGLLLHRDELAGLLGNLDRYGGKGGDRAFWLEAYGGRRYTVDRRSNDKPHQIPHLAISLVGSIQPDRLDEMLLRSDDDGLFARMLLFWPEPAPFRRPRAKPDDTTIKRVYRRLRELDFEAGAAPTILPLADKAADRFYAWREARHAAFIEASGKFGSALGKMPGQALRLALILEHMSWAASNNGPQPIAVSVASVERALKLVDDYFVPMVVRALGEAARSKSERAASVLAREILRRRPQYINERDVRREWQSPGLTTADHVEGAVRELMEANWLARITHTGSGRPPKTYEVNQLVYAKNGSGE